MEEDIHSSIIEQHLPKDKLVETRLDKAISKAQEILDYESAHNSEVLQALDIVKQFIIQKKRVCYGGTAMNALLPKKDKFYDPDYDLPDYDFLTPDGNSDVVELVSKLKSAGFNDVYNRVGVHEGTKKILVNYIAVADITTVDNEIYKIFVENSKVIDNLHYTNEHMLRMMMYLEISRPRGEVERWKKVFERLQLLNKHFPIKKCTKTHDNKINPIKDIIIQYVLSRQRIIANIELETIYKYSLNHSKTFYTYSKYGPVLFYSSDPKKDSYDLKTLINDSSKIKLVYHNGKGDLLPSRVYVYMNNNLAAIIIEETACHSYNNIYTKDKRLVHIASLETLITLHYSLYFFDTNYKTYLCSIGLCINTHHRLASSKRSKLDVFPVVCSGYQKGYPTLLREKVLRIRNQKSRKQSLKKKNTTLKKIHGGSS